MTEIRSYQQANEYLGTKDSRPLRYKTRVERRSPTSIAIQHHNTDIITYHWGGYEKEGTVVIDTQGWRTSTTKERLNAHLPGSYGVWQKDSIWRIWDGGMGKQYIFADGMRILPSGRIEGAGPPVDKLKKLNTEILKYSRNYIKALFAGGVAKPGPGDCWYCLMRADKITSKEPLIVHGRTIGPGKETLGEATENKDHLLSHLDEQYYVPSLLVRAIEVFPVSMAAKGALNDFWGEGMPLEDQKWFYDLAKQQLRSSLHRYLRRQLGLAS